MRKPIHGMIAGASVATAVALTIAVAAAQAPTPQFDLTKVTDAARENSRPELD